MLKRVGLALVSVGVATLVCAAAWIAGRGIQKLLPGDPIPPAVATYWGATGELVLVVPDEDGPLIEQVAILGRSDGGRIITIWQIARQPGARNPSDGSFVVGEIPPGFSEIVALQGSVDDDSEFVIESACRLRAGGIDRPGVEGGDTADVSDERVDLERFARRPGEFGPCPSNIVSMVGILPILAAVLGVGAMLGGILALLHGRSAPVRQQEARCSDERRPRSPGDVALLRRRCGFLAVLAVSCALPAGCGKEEVLGRKEPLGVAEARAVCEGDEFAWSTATEIEMLDWELTGIEASIGASSVIRRGVDWSTVTESGAGSGRAAIPMVGSVATSQVEVNRVAGELFARFDQREWLRLVDPPANAVESMEADGLVDLCPLTFLSLWSAEDWVPVGRAGDLDEEYEGPEGSALQLEYDESGGLVGFELSSPDPGIKYSGALSAHGAVIDDGVSPAAPSTARDITWAEFRQMSFEWSVRVGAFAVGEG